MTELIRLVQEADFALLDVEQTRQAIETAKMALEQAKAEHDRAKGAFEEIITKADEIGVPRGKLKKIIEERTAVLSASGLFSVPVNKVAAQKAPTKAPKKPAKVKPESSQSDEAFVEALNAIKLEAEPAQA